MRTLSKCLILLALSGTVAMGAAAQESSNFELPRTNPKAVVWQQVAATAIEVTYSRPTVRGREIFGALVPYGEVWRTGADGATTISFSTPVSVGGEALAAGTYELFSIPGEKEWVVIFHQHQGQWGSYAYDPANDAARVTVKPRRLDEVVESFTLSIDEVAKSTATLNISWDRVQVPVPIAIDVRATVVPQLEAALAGEGKRPLFQAAMFYFENDLDLDRAAELMSLALEGNPGHLGMLHRLALILERKGDRVGAIAAAEQSLAAAASASSEELREEYERLNHALLARLRQ